ncbi:MAG: hypothetical protein H0X16_07885 [Chloroflexi bacterium]|nr:hypothetical protein [Chloroflexota bacterium]
MGSELRSQVIGRVVDYNHLLEGVRLGQRLPVGTPRDRLIESASASITKNCEAPGGPGRLVDVLALELYR